MIKKETWYSLFFAHAPSLLTIIALDSALNVVHLLMPLWLFSSINNKNLFLFSAIFCLWGVEIFFSAYLRIIYTRLEVAITNKLYYTSYQKLFESDAHADFHKEAGLSISKIERAVQSYKELASTFIFGFLPTLIRTITVIVTLFYYTSPVAPYIALLLILIIFLHIFLYGYILKKKEVDCIKTQDALKNFFITYAPTILLIQISGSIDTILRRLKKRIEADRYNEIAFWKSNAVIHAIVSFLYLITVIILSSYFFYEIFDAKISSSSALGLLALYMRSTNGIIHLERPLRSLTKTLTDIQDFFIYMQSFLENKQTKNLLLNHKEFWPTEIEIKSLTFGYTQDKTIFNSISMSLQVSADQKNKIYAITGPSGSGKSTFALLLSGWIKPLSGTILIQNICPQDLLASERQKLVVIQIQTDSLIPETIYHLLLLGLPEDAYSREYLLEILKEYTLETVHLDKHASLSAGQRQKILCINTYLRARYFKPAIIILDEPTNSLDKVSEEKIIGMIEELAETSVVFLITHKKELLSRAYMTTDFSLVEKDQKINFSWYS